MAPFLKIPSRNTIRSLTVAAIAAVAVAIAVPAGTASGQEQGIDRGVIPVAPDAPSSYIVQPGDTLWDISAKFLTDPWYWPEIWHINPQVANPHLIYPGDTLALTWVDGQPRVAVASGGSKFLPLMPDRHSFYTLVFDNVNGEAYKATSFKISVEPKP